MPASLNALVPVASPLRPGVLATAPRHRLLTGAMVRVLAVDFAAMCSFYLLLSVVPLYATERGVGTAAGGLSTGVLMFAAVAAELATPGLAARIGYRRLLIGGLALLGAPAAALPAVGHLPAVWNLPALMAVSVLRGLGFAVVVVAVGAVAAAAIPAERRGEGLGVLGVAAMLPAVGALPLGVWLAGRLGYPVVFAAAAGAALLAVVPAVRLPDSRGEDGPRGGLAKCLRRAGLRRPAVVFAGTAVAGGVVVAYLPGAVAPGVAVPALLVQSVAATAARWLAGRYGDRRGPAGMLVPAVAACTAGLAAAAFTGSGPAVLAGMAVFGTGFGVAQAGSLNTMLSRASSAQYGAVSATWNAAYDLGWGAGAIGLGMVACTAGCPAAFTAAAVLVAATLPLAFLTRATGRAASNRAAA